MVADDLGYGDLSCYGNTILSTPNIDRLAAEGVRCSQHYSGAPLCAPARAALLTGRYHHRCGALSVESNRGLDRIALRERTMGDVFAAAGYHTGYVGKWHSGLHDRRYPPTWAPASARSPCEIPAALLLSAGARCHPLQHSIEVSYQLLVVGTLHLYSVGMLGGQSTKLASSPHVLADFTKLSICWPTLKLMQR